MSVGSECSFFILNFDELCMERKDSVMTYALQQAQFSETANHHGAVFELANKRATAIEITNDL